jgi:hypothetical protein
LAVVGISGIDVSAVLETRRKNVESTSSDVAAPTVESPRIHFSPAP